MSNFVDCLRNCASVHGRSKRFLFSKFLKPALGSTHLLFIGCGWDVFPQVYSNWDVMLTTHTLIVAGMFGVVPPLAQYAYVVCTGMLSPVSKFIDVVLEI